MSNVASIGERLYRKVVTPVYSEDRQFYDCGCIVHGADGGISVVFLRYKSTGGIVGRCKPSQEMAGWLKQYGRELKEYILSYYPTPVVGSEKTKSANVGNGKGQRNLLTNEK